MIRKYLVTRTSKTLQDGLDQMPDPLQFEDKHKRVTVYSYILHSWAPDGDGYTIVWELKN